MRPYQTIVILYMCLFTCVLYYAMYNVSTKCTMKKSQGHTRCMRKGLIQEIYTCTCSRGCETGWPAVM